MKLSRFVPAASLLLFAACGEDLAIPDEEIASAVVELATVPGNVKCVHLIASGQGTTYTESFSVTAGATATSLPLRGLPEGELSLKGSAYPTACPNTTSPPSGEPTWIASPVSFVNVFGVPSRVALELRRNQTVDGTVDFQESVQAVSAGLTASYALLADGSLRSWGTSQYGELGTGVDVEIQKLPVPVQGNLSGLVGLRAGLWRVCAWTPANLYCWGAEFQASGGFVARNTPKLITGNWTGVLDVAQGSNHVCMLSSDSRVSCWGLNTWGQVGVTPSNTPVLVPSEVSYPLFRQITAGQIHTCGAANDGRVWCWGSNHYNQFGDGGQVQFDAYPHATQGVTGAVEVAAGNYHTCARRNDGQVFCWGSNGAGQLGDGTKTNRTTAVPVVGLTDAIGLAAGTSHTCALRKNGEVKCWGSNYNGQLGNGTGVESTVPVTVSGLTGITSIHAMHQSFHTCARNGEGEAWCWGQGSSYALGTGQPYDEFAPVKVDF